MEQSREPHPTGELDPRFSDPGAGPTAWDRVRAALVEAELSWISTVRRSGRPHVTPIPAVWYEGALYFCTGPTEQKAVNLAANPECVLTTGSDRWNSGLDVVVEGRARRVTDDALLHDLAAAWATKFAGEWIFDVVDGAFHHDAGDAHVFEVRPRKVVSFAKGDFAQTSFVFDDDSRPEP
jgi:hypothetical protein